MKSQGIIGLVSTRHWQLARRFWTWKDEHLVQTTGGRDLDVSMADGRLGLLAFCGLVRLRGERRYGTHVMTVSKFRRIYDRPDRIYRALVKY